MKTRSFIITVTIFFIAGFLVACGSKKDNGAVARPGGPGYVGPGGGICSGCNETNLLYSALGRSSVGIEMEMDFFAINTTATNVYGGYYSGPVAAAGRMTVVGGSLGYCSIPRGIYDIQTLNGSQGYVDQSGLVRGLRMRAIGNSVEVIMIQDFTSFINGSLRSCSGEIYTTEMLGHWYIQAVNGQPCNGSLWLSGGSAGSCI